MINKTLFSIFALLVSCSFISANEYQPMPYNDWYYANNAQHSEPDCDYDVYDAYRYVSFGTGPIILIPNVGIGYRERYARLGWDSSLNFSTIGYAHQLSGHVVGHFYLNPKRQNSVYLGLGLLGSGIVTNKGKGCGTLSPDFVIGKELQRTDECRQFVEMHVGIPTLCMNSKHSDTTYLPLMYIRYGVSF